MRTLSSLEILHVFGGAIAGENPQSDPVRDAHFNALLERDLFEQDTPSEDLEIDEGLI